MASPKTKEFKAWINSMPGSDPALIVIGKVETSASNMTPTLTPSVPQGINPQILFLDLAIVDTGGVGTQAFQFRDVRYEKPASAGQYTEVTIFYQGAAIESMKVSEAS